MIVLFRRVFRQGLAEQHFDISLISQTFARSQSARRFQVLLRYPQRDRLRRFCSLEQIAQRQRSLLLHPLPDFGFDFGAMSVPPRRFLGLTGKLRNSHLLHFRFCHIHPFPRSLRYIAAVSLSEGHPVIGRMASPRTANTMLNMRPARVAPTATQRCSLPSV
jgi:hypothetical protein